MAQLLVDAVHGALALDVHQCLDAVAHLFLCFFKLGQIGVEVGHLDLVGQIVLNRVGEHEISVGQALHQRRGTEAIGSVVGEVGLADGEESRNAGHQFVVNPNAAHGVMERGEDHHRRLVGILVDDLLIHLEEVAVFLLYYVTAQALDGVSEVEVDGEARVVHAEACIATFLGCT